MVEFFDFFHPVKDVKNIIVYLLLLCDNCLSHETEAELVPKHGTTCIFRIRITEIYAALSRSHVHPFTTETGIFRFFGARRDHF